MHTGEVTGRLARALVGALLCAGLVACSDDSGDADDAGSGSSGSESTSGSGSDSASPTDSLLVPDGVDLTDQGSTLDVGDTATVAYEVRQGVVGVLDITVTRLERTSFEESFVGWDLKPETRAAKPYFVRATVTNRGETDLGGRPVPLYIVDGTDILVEATSFASTFAPCHPGAFPQTFTTGKTLDVCLVYLAPNKGDLTAASFRPTQTNLPITWTGDLQKPRPPKPGKGKDR